MAYSCGASFAPPPEQILWEIYQSYVSNVPSASRKLATGNLLGISNTLYDILADGEMPSSLWILSLEKDVTESQGGDVNQFVQGSENP